MKLLHPHLDGELDIKESIRVQTHLQECRYCRENFVAEKTFRDLVHQHVTPAPAPPFARQCVSAALSREARHAARKPARRWSPRLMAMTIALGCVILVLAVSSGIFGR
ncbi:MAG: zf-HC2 domain-containing protein, partial [Nitrospiria bacterium]